MVADDNKDSGFLEFDSKDVKTWVKEFRIQMMKKNRNQLGLRPHGLVQPVAGGRLVLEDYNKKVEAWRERNDSCVAAIFESCKEHDDAFELVDQYIETKENLPDGDPNKDPLASELIAILIHRFEEEKENEIGDLSSQFTNFAFDPLKPTSASVDRLQGICTKLSQHERPVVAEAKLTKLMEAMKQVQSLEQLWLTISMAENKTFASVSAACKRWDSSKKSLEKDKIEVHYNDGSEEKPLEIVCSYPKCGKTGHTQAQCFKKKRDQKNAQFKRQGRSRAREDKNRGSPSKGGQAPGRKGFRGCFCCGKDDHRADRCPQGAHANRDSEDDEDSDDGHSNSRKRNKEFSRNPRDYINDRGGKKKRGEGHMLSDFADEPEECLLSLSEENEVVFLDSCASKSIFIVKDANVMERVEPIRSSIQTTRADVQLECVGEGTFQHWTDVRVCPGSVKNIVSGGLLRAKGYGLMLLLEPQIVRLSDQSVVLPAKYAQNGMPYVLLWDLLNLPDLLMEESSEQVLLSDKIEIDPLELLHMRCGHVSKSKLLEAFRNCLVTGSGLQRKHLSKKA